MTPGDAAGGGKRTTRRVVILSGLGVLAGGALVPDLYRRLANQEQGQPPEPTPFPFPAEISTETTYTGSLIPGSPESVGAPPGRLDDDLNTWAKGRDGTNANASSVSVMITSPREAIVLVGVRIVVTRRADPLSGLYLGVTGAGEATERGVFAELDRDPVKVQTYSDSSDWDFPVSIDANDTFALRVSGRAERSMVEWWMEVDYISNGVERAVRIMDGEDPFIVTSPSAATHEWSFSKEEWIKRV